MFKTLIKLRVIFTSIIMMCTLLCSCVEEYWPELNETHLGTLVVDGKISNQAGPYRIKLSYSQSLNDSIIKPATGASIRILDNEGQIENLTEIQPGIYQTSNPDYRGVIGKSYQLVLTTSSGSTYESTFEKILSPNQIETVSFNEEERLIDELNGIGEKGFRFKVSSSESNVEENFFYYELEETYEYKADKVVLWYFDGVYDPNSDGYLNTPKALPFHKEIRNCWTNNQISEFYTTNTSSISGSKVQDYPLHFIEYSNEKLKVQYSLLVKQHNIGKQAYNYLNGLQEQNSSQGNFYSNHPYQIQGNIHSTNNSKEIVLGYFLAAGTSDPKRIFTHKPSEVEGPATYVEDCDVPIFNEPGEVPPRLDRIIMGASSRELPLYFTFISIQFDGSTLDAQAYYKSVCFDCRLRGGEITKPAFWVNN